jgi:hypothetical protein
MIERVLELLGKGFCGVTPGLKLNSFMGLRKPCLMLEKLFGVLVPFNSK